MVRPGNGYFLYNPENADRQNSGVYFLFRHCTNHAFSDASIATYCCLDMKYIYSRMSPAVDFTKLAGPNRGHAHKTVETS